MSLRQRIDAKLQIIIDLVEKCNRTWAKYYEKYKEKHFRNHCKRRDERNGDVARKVEVEISLFDGEYVVQRKSDKEVYDEPLSILDRTFFLSVEVENTMVQISKDFSAEPTAKC